MGPHLEKKSNKRILNNGSNEENSTRHKRPAVARTTSSSKQPARLLRGAKQDRSQLFQDIGFEPLTLPQIYDHVELILREIPKIPKNKFRADGHHHPQKRPVCLPPLKVPPTQFDKAAIREWADQVDKIMDELFPLLSMSDTATYRWKLDRSGASEQNWTTLKEEVNTVLEHLNRTVAAALDDILAPETTLLRDKTVKTTHPDGREDQQNHFIRTPDDPDAEELVYTRFAHKATLLRQLLIANMVKLLQVLHDYYQAQESDNQHDTRTSLY